MLLGALLAYTGACNRDAHTSIHTDAEPEIPPTMTKDAGAPADVDGGNIPQPDPCATTAAIPSFAESVASPTTASYSIASARIGFTLAYRSDSNCSQLLATPLPTSGVLPQGAIIAGENDCTRYREVALLPLADDRAQLSFVDNSSGHAELFTQALDPRMVPSADPIRLTDNDAQERGLAMATLGAGPAVAYVERKTSGDALRLRVLDATEAALLVPEGAGHRPSGLAMTALTAGGAVAWVNSEGEHPGVWLNALTTDGEANGTPVALSPLSGPTASVDLAVQNRGGDAEQGGAAVYSVWVGETGRELRFRRLDARGAPRDQERKLLGAPLRAGDASITSLGDAYAVAYRALADGVLITEPQIRLLFVSAEGDVQRDDYGRPRSHFVDSASNTAGRLTVRSSTDGRLLIGWVDGDDSGRFQLRLSRLQLDCAL